MRELDIALKKISVRQHNAFALRASLHGYKIPLKQPVAPTEPTAPPVDEKLADGVMAAALARKQKEMANGKPK